MPNQQIASELSFRSSTSNPSEIRYWKYVPNSTGDSAKLPLMLFLHGAGERGDDLTVVKKHGPPKLIEQGKELPFVVLSPQCAKGKYWAMRDNLDMLRRLISHTQAELPIDESRIYCTGLSMGGYGTWAMGAKYPDLFAALIPVCGGGNIEHAKALAQTPIWAFHGSDDRVVPPIRSQEMVDAIKEEKGDIKLTIYDKVGHDSWTETYNNSKIYDWLLSHQNTSGKGN